WRRGGLGSGVLVERVVHRELARHVVEVIAADRLEARRRGVETGGLGREAPVVRVGAADDRGEGRQRRVGELVTIDEGIEGALRAVVAQIHGWNVVGDRVLPLAYREHLPGRDKQELGP